MFNANLVQLILKVTATCTTAQVVHTFFEIKKKLMLQLPQSTILNRERKAWAHPT